MKVCHSPTWKSFDFPSRFSAITVSMPSLHTRVLCLISLLSLPLQAMWSPQHQFHRPPFNSWKWAFALMLFPLLLLIFWCSFLLTVNIISLQVECMPEMAMSSLLLTQKNQNQKIVSSSVTPKYDEHISRAKMAEWCWKEYSSYIRLIILAWLLWTTRDLTY